jgi:disulfide bond formation protein DsbB
MKCNVGGMDRIGRLVLGVVLLIIGFLAPLEPLWQTIIFIIAAIALITGIFRFCPANALFGIDTCHPGGKGGRTA